MLCNHVYVQIWSTDLFCWVQLFDLIVGLDDVSDEQKARIFKRMGEADKVIFLELTFCSICFLWNQNVPCMLGMIAPYYI